ncbi:hypothetical protein C1646_723413 [Rhizophagus diaphanus]|nr:hypothetical protein C1646_723413 [Rhizophagus diaphanus] [Rhizophagus sp. MUCL 43196]
MTRFIYLLIIKGVLFVSPRSTYTAPFKSYLYDVIITWAKYYFVKESRAINLTMAPLRPVYPMFINERSSPDLKFGKFFMIFS